LKTFSGSNGALNKTQKIIKKMITFLKNKRVFIARENLDNANHLHAR